MKHNPTFIQAISIARAATTKEERELVLKLLDHAATCRICCHYIAKEGFDSISRFRDYLLREWNLPPYDPIASLCVDKTEVPK